METSHMSIPVCFLTPEGDLVPAPFEAKSLDEVGALEPDGIYTITRTFHGDRAVMLDAHMDRLEESARLEDIPLELDRSWLRSGLRRLLERADNDESRFRITIPRQNPQTALLAIEPLKIITEAKRMSGVAVATMCIDRPNPKAKSNRWIQLREEARRQLPEWAYEGLVCAADAHILEGFSSNFYAVTDGILRTAQDVVLSGIARKILLKVTEGLIEVSYDPIRREDVALIDEAMLSSSSRGIVPIVRIDDHIIGNGTPGPIALELWQCYQAWVEEHLVKI
jgi:branched-chain amino acid aminotransferase